MYLNPFIAQFGVKIFVVMALFVDLYTRIWVKGY